MGLYDKAIDGVVSKLTGKKIQTEIVSLDEILDYLDKVLSEVEKSEISEIEKVIKGSFWSALHMYDTKNEKYRVSTIYTGTIASRRIFNNISIMELEKGLQYSYKSFLFKGKFKKAALKLINKYKTI